MAVFALLESSKLISRKIKVSEKSHRVTNDWQVFKIKVVTHSVEHDWRLQSESARMKALGLNDKAETEDF